MADDKTCSFTSSSFVEYFVDSDPPDGILVGVLAAEEEESSSPLEAAAPPRLTIPHGASFVGVAVALNEGYGDDEEEEDEEASTAVDCSANNKATERNFIIARVKNGMKWNSDCNGRTEVFLIGMMVMDDKK
jgi:hypothetical protein